MATGLTFNIFGHDVSASSTLHHVEGQAQSTSSTIGGHFKKMGGVIAGAFAGAGIADFIGGAMDEATEAQKVGAQTAAVLKSTGQAAGVSAQQIGDLANAISAKAGIDDEAIQSGENLLLTFTNVRNEAGKGNDVFNQATQAMTDLSVATGESMKSASIQLGKALNDPIKGVTALSRVGVTFTQQQKDQIKAMVDAGNTMGAQKIILGELNKEFGGSAAAQATASDKMKVAFGNLEEQVGTALMPVISGLADFISKTLIPIISKIVSWITEHKQGFIQLGKAILAVAKGIYENVLKPAIEAIIKIVQSIIGWIKDHKKGLEQLAHVIGVVLKGAFTVLVDAFKVGWAVIKGIFTVFATIVEALWKTARWIFQHIGAAWRGIGDVVKTVWTNTIGRIWGLVKTGVHGVGAAIHTAAKIIVGAWHWIGHALTEVWDHTLGPIFDKITAFVGSIGYAISTLRGNGGLQFNPGDTGWLNKYGHHAQGVGFSTDRGLAWVGENGPELVRLPRGSAVVPHSAAMSGQRGGDHIEVHLHVTGAVVANEAQLQRTVVKAFEQYPGMIRRRGTGAVL